MEDIRIMENSEKLISIIIPIYNKENELEKTVESVIGQTYQDLEIILVDDGSTDTSYSMCCKYKQKDNRIIVLTQENKGVSAARNYGISVAQGEWISFIDAGDYVERDYYKKVMSIAEEFNAEVICAGVMKENSHHNFSLETETLSKEVATQKQAIQYLLERKKMTIAVYDKIFRRKCVCGNLFCEKITHNEDFLFVYQVIKNVSTVVIDTQNIAYYYTYLENGASRSRFSKKQMSIVKAQDYVFQDIKKKYPELFKDALKNYIQSLLLCLSLAVKANYNNKDDLKLIQNKIMKYTIPFLKSNAAIGYKILTIASINLKCFKILNKER